MLSMGNFYNLVKQPEILKCDFVLKPVVFVSFGKWYDEVVSIWRLEVYIYISICNLYFVVGLGTLFTSM